MNFTKNINSKDLEYSEKLDPILQILKEIRIEGLQNHPRCKELFDKVGVFPVSDHYYEPLFITSDLEDIFDKERNLPGIDLNVNGQLELFRSFDYSKEFQHLYENNINGLNEHINNGAFRPGDAEIWYSFVRHFKPNSIVEIGSGTSTVIALTALEENRNEIGDLEKANHICIEPYEMPWLEGAGVDVVRERVEKIPIETFSVLKRNDILFIDSSHIIRPQGDVLHEFLQILPSLESGVIVHVHDIFTPRDYPKFWLKDMNLLWNEQYLLEAFLTSNNAWEVIGSLNYLHHNYANMLQSRCPYLKEEHEPGSFYIRKR